VFDLIKANPVRARAALVALIAILGRVFPAVSGIDADAVITALTAVAALWAGHSAASRVTLTEHAEAETAKAVEAARSACCECPHTLPEPNEPQFGAVVDETAAQSFAWFEEKPQG
jgi:hypothetical protein